MRREPFDRRLQRLRFSGEPLIKPLCHLASVALLIGVWQAFGNSFGILFVPFTTTMARLWDMVAHGPLLSALATSATLYATTLALSILIGVSVGLVLARMRTIAAAVEPYIFVLYAMPTISLVPFVSVMFGFDFWPQVLVAVLISIFPILLGTAQGARSIPQKHLDVAAMFGSTEAQLWGDVILPYVVPFAMSGIKQSITLSIAGTLVAEFFLNPEGLAALLLQGTTVVDSASVLAITVLVAILAILLGSIGEGIERRLVGWQRTAVG